MSIAYQQVISESVKITPVVKILIEYK
jgi:hypothetical protein